MSQTPRDDERPEFSDPTAPSEPVSHDDYTAPIETTQTQQVPQVPGASEEPSGTGGADHGDVPPAPPGGPVPPSDAPQNPYASPPASGAPAPQNPYAMPPSGGQDPYAASAPGGYGSTPPAGPSGYGIPASPYGATQPGYGQQPAGYGNAPQGYGPPPPGYGSPYARPANSMSGNTIALLVVSGLATLSCGFGIIALVFAILAATKNDQPEEQAKFTRWGWWALGITVVLGIIAIVLIALAVGIAGTSSYSTGY